MSDLKRVVKALRRIVKRVLRRGDHRAHIIELIQPRFVCAEIGVWKGEFSKKILARGPSRLHLIDPWLYLPEFGNRSYGARGDNSQRRMDGICYTVKKDFDNDPAVVIHRETSEQAVERFSDGYFDFIYLDGNHNYEFVRKELMLYLVKVKKGRYLTGDDYVFDRCTLGGPKRAVEEFLHTGLVELVSIKNNQFILKRT